MRLRELRTFLAGKIAPGCSMRYQGSLKSNLDGTIYLTFPGGQEATCRVPKKLNSKMQTFNGRMELFNKIAELAGLSALHIHIGKDWLAFFYLPSLGFSNMNASQENLKRECAERWKQDKFIEQIQRLPSQEYRLPWVAYETYMMTQLVDVQENKVSRLKVKFPPEATEDNRLHIHPISDRIITVIDGSGDFIAVRENREKHYRIEPGMRVWMPRGTVHTFKAGTNGLLVESIHNPFIPFDNPHCLVYPKKPPRH